MSETLHANTIEQSSARRLTALGAAVALFASGCSTEVEGTPYPKDSGGDLEIQKTIDARSFPGMGGKETAQLKVGERVIGVCLSYPSWEADTAATGFMKVQHFNKEYYVPTVAGYTYGKPQPTFQVPEENLDKNYLRCTDSRRL